MAVARHKNRAKRHSVNAQKAATASSEMANSITGYRAFRPSRDRQQCPSTAYVMRREEHLLLVATTEKGSAANLKKIAGASNLSTVQPSDSTLACLQTDVTGSSDRQCKRPGHTRKLRDQRRRNPPWPAKMMTRGDSTQRPAQKLRDAFPPRPGP